MYAETNMRRMILQIDENNEKRVEYKLHPMNKKERQFVHELSDLYNIYSTGRDIEPNRYLILVAEKGKYYKVRFRYSCSGKAGYARFLLIARFGLKVISYFNNVGSKNRDKWFDDTIRGYSFFYPAVPSIARGRIFFILVF